MRRYYLAAAALLGLFVIAGSIEQADATNIDVSVSSGCVDGTTWQVTLDAHNTHDATLRVVNDNNVENYSAILAPGEAQHVRLEPSDRTFAYVWSSPDAHLVGVLSGTLTRPDGCAPPPTVPTTEAPPSTTTSPTTVPTAPSTSVPSVSVSPPPVASTATGAPTPGGAPSPSRPPSSTPTDLTLPTTGSNTTLGVVVGLGFVLVGLLAATRRRAT